MIKHMKRIIKISVIKYRPIVVFLLATLFVLIFAILKSGPGSEKPNFEMLATVIFIYAFAFFGVARSPGLIFL